MVLQIPICQIVVELGKYDDDFFKKITTSTALKVSGTVVPSLGKGQKAGIKGKQY